jgi:ubiquinone/menaquinone biosynthesis C-methylase UbiE
MTGPDKEQRVLGTQAAYDLWSTTYDDHANGLIVLERRFAIPRLDPRPDERILDAGCGTGDHLTALTDHGSSPIGLDLSLGMLQRARMKAPSVPVLLASLSEGLPFKPDRFDGVLCSLVSEHLTDLNRFFSEIYRVLRPGGRLVFSGLHPERVADGLTAGFEVDGRRYRVDAAPHTLADFVDAARRSGLDVTRIEEARVDHNLVQVAPRVGRFLEQKLLFVMSARRLLDSPPV